MFPKNILSNSLKILTFKTLKLIPEKSLYAFSSIPNPPTDKSTVELKLPQKSERKPPTMP